MLGLRLRVRSEAAAWSQLIPGRTNISSIQVAQERIRERIEVHRNAGKEYMVNGVRILKLAQNAYSIYLTQDSWEKRKLLDWVHSNSVLAGGEVFMEMEKPFKMIVDGIVQEEKLKREKAPLEVIN